MGHWWVWGRASDLGKSWCCCFFYAGGHRPVARPDDRKMPGARRAPLALVGVVNLLASSSLFRRVVEHPCTVLDADAAEYRPGDAPRRCAGPHRRPLLLL